MTIRMAARFVKPIKLQPRAVHRTKRETGADVVCGVCGSTETRPRALRASWYVMVTTTAAIVACRACIDTGCAPCAVERAASKVGLGDFIVTHEDDHTC